ASCRVDFDRVGPAIPFEWLENPCFEAAVSQAETQVNGAVQSFAVEVRGRGEQIVVADEGLQGRNLRDLTASPAAEPARPPPTRQRTPCANPPTALGTATLGTAAVPSTRDPPRCPAGIGQSSSPATGSVAIRRVHCPSAASGDEHEPAHQGEPPATPARPDPK